MQIVRCLWLAAGLVLPAACGSGGGDTATETNVMPLPCTTDAECGGLRCIPGDAEVPDGGFAGVCEVATR